mmetsp:Transcript_110541/g.277899  ORF Transcript_110541/g.277899 Transcript_110541/m.277899 type:complete len:93 (-) Transcript_110541:3-281(-)
MVLGCATAACTCRLEGLKSACATDAFVIVYAFALPKEAPVGGTAVSACELPWHFQCVTRSPAQELKSLACSISGVHVASSASPGNLSKLAVL